MCSLKFLFPLLLAINCLWLFVFIEAKSIDKINKYLTSKCSDTESLGCNLVAAKELLTETYKKGFSILSDNRSLANDLQTFISLEEIVTKVERCNGRTVKILRDNEKMVGLGDENKKPASSGRLETLVTEAITLHHNQCKDVYTQKLAKVRQECEDVSDSIEKAEKSTAHMSPEATPNEHELAHKGLVEAVKEAGDADVKFALSDTFQAEQYGLLYEEYLEQPCMYYVFQFGEDVIEPAIFDGAEKTLGNTYKTYTICKRIIKKGYRQELLDKMKKVAANLK